MCRNVQNRVWVRDSEHGRIASWWSVRLDVTVDLVEKLHSEETKYAGEQSRNGMQCRVSNTKLTMGDQDLQRWLKKQTDWVNDTKKTPMKVSQKVTHWVNSINKKTNSWSQWHKLKNTYVFEEPKVPHNPTDWVNDIHELPMLESGWVSNANECHDSSMGHKLIYNIGGEAGVGNIM